MGKCPLCGQVSESRFEGPLNQTELIKCQNCGMFRISDKAEDALFQFEDKHLLSGYTRENSDNNNIVLITSDGIENIINNPLVANTVEKKTKKLLKWFYNKSGYYGQEIDLCNEPAICYAKNSSELLSLVEYASERGLIRNIGRTLDPFESSYLLTAKGFSVCESDSNNMGQDTYSAFVAMWFSSEMKDIYDSAIKPAIEYDGSPYKAFRVDTYEHNNDITDEIIAGIQKSAFVVADMSGNRGGVYYEAGYARGIGKPVIYTCQKEWFEGEKDMEGNVTKEKIHFDINHLNIIVWTTAEELRTKLTNRIKATIK